MEATARAVDDCGTYTLEDNSTTDVVGTINNTGTILFAQVNNNGVLRFDGPVTLTGGGTVTMTKAGSGSSIMNQAGSGSLVNVNNLIQGVGEIGNDGLQLTNEAAGVINATGSTLTIDVGGAFLNQGLVENTGAGVMQINASVENAGQIFPDGTNLSISQTGGYTQDASGALDIVVGNSGVSSHYGTNNGSTIAGAVNIIFAPGFVPAAGNSWNIYSADAINGTFTQINAPSLGGTLIWQITYTDTATLSIVSTTTSPQTLTVTDQGMGSGTVTDDLNQISCTEIAGVTQPNSVCSSSYYFNSVVNLTATPSGSSVFSGWGGACSGTGACQVTMSQAQAVTATFTPTPTSITLNFTASATPQTQEAIFDCPSNTNPCTDPNAHALALTVQGVNAPFSVTVMAESVPTSQADGICENGNNVTDDFDCRFVTFFGGPQVTAGQEVPLCDPYSNGNCVHYLVFSGTPGTEPDPNSYVGPSKLDGHLEQRILHAAITVFDDAAALRRPGLSSV